MQIMGHGAVKNVVGRGEALLLNSKTLRFSCVHQHTIEVSFEMTGLPYQ